MLTFCGGLGWLAFTNTALSKLGYVAINLALLAVSVWMQRRSFVVFASLGLFAYVADLTTKHGYFSIILIVIGLLIVVGASFYSRQK